MKKLSLEKRAILDGLLVEGNSIRATSRLSGVAFQSVINFVADIGRACTDYQDKTIQNIKVKPALAALPAWPFLNNRGRDARATLFPLAREPGISTRPCLFPWKGMPPFLTS